jgi:hypothetical protein
VIISAEDKEGVQPNEPACWSCEHRDGDFCTKEPLTEYTGHPDVVGFVHPGNAPGALNPGWCPLVER